MFLSSHWIIHHHHHWTFQTSILILFFVIVALYWVSQFVFCTIIFCWTLFFLFLPLLSLGICLWLFYVWNNALIFLFLLCLKPFIACNKFVWELKTKNMVLEVVTCSWKQTKQVPKVASFHNFLFLNKCLWVTLVTFRHYKLCHEIFGPSLHFYLCDF